MKNDLYSEILILHRRSTGLKGPKISEHIIDFDNKDTYEKYLQGDVLFSTLGTTLKTAGSKNAQYKVDYQYQYDIAEAASKKGIKQYVLVSAAGANSQSSNFYTKMKGSLDDAVQKLAFQKIRIIRPSILDGNRQENRLGERIGLAVMRVLKYIPFIKKYRPIHVDIVAKAMQKSLLDNQPLEILSLEEIFEKANS